MDSFPSYYMIFMKRTYWIIAILLLCIAGIFSIQFLVPGYLATIFGRRALRNICIKVEPSQRDLCKTNPLSLLQEGKGKSASLNASNISRYKIGLMEFQPRKDVPIWKISFPIPWDTDPFNDRNWRMSLNAGRIADNCMTSYQASKKPEMFRCAFDIFKDWYDFHMVRRVPNKFAWYDMSVAYRADRISKLLDWASQDPLLSNDEAKLLFKLAFLHIEYLLNPENLNEGNHAVFQLASLERICKVTPYIDYCDAAHEWTPKMIELLTKSQFGEDGLQLEHSPGYHFFMVKTYQSLIEEGVFPLTPESIALYNKAKEMRFWLTSPDGEIPSIGDTGDDTIVKLKETDPDNGTFKVLPKDGLAIVRTPKSRLWFYGFHHSKVHKHDDDLSFYLWDRDQPLLIDAGKYAYDSNEKRDYVLSRAAHNTAIIPGLSLNRSKFYGSGIKNLKKNGDEYFSTGSVQYENGISHTRQLDFHPEKSLKITDKFEGLQTVEINFLLSPKLEKIKTHGNKVTFQNKKLQLTIDTKTLDCKVQTYKGVKDEKGMRGWYSPAYKELEPTWSVTFECPASQEIVTEISY